MISFATIVRALRNLGINFYIRFFILSSAWKHAKLFSLIPVPLSDLAESHVKLDSYCNLLSVVPCWLLLEVFHQYIDLIWRFFESSAFLEVSDVGLFDLFASSFEIKLAVLIYLSGACVLFRVSVNESFLDLCLLLLGSATTDTCWCWVFHGSLWRDNFESWLFFNLLSLGKDSLFNFRNFILTVDLSERVLLGSWKILGCTFPWSVACWAENTSLCWSWDLLVSIIWCIRDISFVLIVRSLLKLLVLVS